MSLDIIYFKLRSVNFLENFEDIFKRATGNDPYPFQKKLATNFDLLYLINIPTGAGKTDGIVLSWIWRRRFQDDENIRSKTPRRLIYCLPTRVLVEQTRDKIIYWLYNLGLLSGKVELESLKEDNSAKIFKNYQPSWNDPNKIAVTVLMGGESKDLWDIYPERDAIIIGTQDMLLSRALNRGYGMSKYRWPMHFGLLNNDSCWIMDEVQLMGNGLITSIQMDSFREYYKTAKRTQTIWMSATINKNWFNTIDFKKDFGDINVLSLTDTDYKNDQINKILDAKKTYSYIKKEDIYNTIKSHHTEGDNIIVIMNTVKEAKEIYKTLKNKNLPWKVMLIHSQFRPIERNEIVNNILNPKNKGSIIISTQVIEAGVDISANVLITELAPFPSLIQRFGRCNRRGEYLDAKVFLIDILANKKNANIVLPYTIEELEESKKLIANLDNISVSPRELMKLKDYYTEYKRDIEVIRKKDIFELFDTVSNIVSEDIDISKYIRDLKDTNVQVFWRDFEFKDPTKDEPLPNREELCSAPITDIKKLLDEGIVAWSWDYFEGAWVRVNSNNIYPGGVILFNSKDGHYSLEEGWSVENKDKVMPIKLELPKNENNYDDRYNITLQTNKNNWENIAQHTNKVVEKASLICNQISLSPKFSDAVKEGARWHDAGKAHPIFQKGVYPDKLLSEYSPIAKAPKEAWVPYNKRDRKYFRHELVSGLLAILNNKSDLTAYLAASHHGKVRLSIRSMPGEIVPSDKKTRFARGVWDGDKVPETDLGGDVVVPQTVIDLSLMELGDGVRGPSWLSRMLSLCEDPEWGIFVLGYLESLVRAADERASGGL
jgi:CRISPR-associated endonuclease/helicase Cas3